ncbi:MAG: collagen binding domain-containing protein [Mediterraneibacter gnavus]|uniref:MSCRAMM family protein n=1 Tax=Mediterraneibacter gnavus TaxID=33038 RepID=UPI0036D2B7FC
MKILYSDYFDAGLETVYVKEITAPEGYVINKTVYPVHVSAGQTVEVNAVDTRVKGKITVEKQDVDTGSFLPQGDAQLAGAVYGLYARTDIQNPDGTGVLYEAGSLIAQQTFLLLHIRIPATYEDEGECVKLFRYKFPDCLLYFHIMEAYL